MAVQEQTPYIEHIANGVTTSFALGFVCDSVDNLVVTINDLPTNVGDWSFSDGNVVFQYPPLLDSLIKIWRNSPLARSTTFKTYDNSLNPNSLNFDLDKIWLVMQELNVKNFISDNKLQELLDKLVEGDINGLPAEVLARIAGDESIKSLVNLEAIRAHQAESNLSIRIDNESLLANQNILAEKQRAEAAEQGLQIQVNSVGVGNKAYKTYALMDADKANIPAKSKVTVTNDETASNNGDWQWDGSTFTKSTYDPLTQAKNYTDESSLDSMRRLTQFSEAKDQILAEFIGDGLLGVASNGVGYSVGLDVENNSINYIDFTFGNLQNINSFDFQIFERSVDNYTVMPGALTDKLIYEKAYTAKEVAQHNIINSSLLYNTVRFNFPALTFTDKQRIIFTVSSDSVFSCEIKAVSPSDTSITDSRGGFYKHATVGWTSFNSGDRRIAYKAGYSDGSNEVIDNVALNETVIAKQLSDSLYFYKRTDVNWTAFGRGFSTHANQKFNKIGLWFANLSDVAKLDYRVIARPIANALDVVWIGAKLLDREIYKSSINISGQYDDEQIEHLINFEFNEKLVPANHYVMIIVTASKADGSIATFGSASRSTASTNRVDQGVCTIDNTDPSFIAVGNEIPFILSFVERANVVEGVNNLKQIVDSIPKPENTITPIFQPILKAESFGLNVDLTGTVINQVGRQTELINVITHEPTTSGTATVTSTLVKSNYVNWTQNLNPWLGYMNISNVVVTNTDNSAVLTRGVEYDYDSDGGKLIGLTNTTYNVSVSFTYTNSRYDLIQINPFTLDVTMLKGVERGFDPMEWMIEATAPNRPLCRVLVVGNRTEIVPLDEYISCGGKPYVMRNDFLALKVHNDSCLKRVQAKLAKDQNINLIGYGDSITAMGGFHTEDIPNENHDWHGFFATFPQDLRDRIPTYMYDSGVGGRIKVGWNWKLKEHIEAVHGNTVNYYNFGVSGTNSTDGARDVRMSYPLAYNPDLIVVAFGMNDLGDTILYSNLVKIVNTFKAAGSDVVLMPVVRTPTLPDTLYQIEDWRKVNRLIYSAAIDSGAAYVPIDWYADDEHYGGMGINFKHFCSQSRFNHPGPYEYSIYGKILVSIFE